MADVELNDAEIQSEIEQRAEDYEERRRDEDRACGLLAVGPVCAAFGPDASEYRCPHGSCHPILARTDAPTWWTPDDWPDGEVPF